MINFYIEGSVWDFDFLINWIVMRFRNDITELYISEIHVMCVISAEAICHWIIFNSLISFAGSNWNEL